MADGGKRVEADTGASQGADVSMMMPTPLPTHAPASKGPPPGNGAAGEPVPVKSKPGRPKGSPKVPGSGRRKGKPNALGRAAREYLAAESGYLDMIAKVCAGKAVRMAGPTGKKTWHYPDWADRKWAVELVSSKCIPTMSAAEVTGADGKPLFEETRREKLLGTMEQARRVAYLLAKGDLAKREIEEMDAPEPATEPEPKPIPEPAKVTEPEKFAEPPRLPPEPTDSPLPRHRYVFIEEGERERSGSRAWLALEGRQVLKTFHGRAARQKARAWVAMKFNASPAEEIEGSR